LVLKGKIEIKETPSNKSHARSECYRGVSLRK